MDGDRRREMIMSLLRNATQPLSGSGLASGLSVSRQVIVQDIALLRAVNKNILSTNKGYVLFREDNKNKKINKIIKVKHDDSEILDELYTIVDNGGRVLDVVVEHPIYGQISADLIINSRADADCFVEQVRINSTKPLNKLTEGVHYHTVEGCTIEVIGKIEQELMKKGYLIK